MAGWPVVAHFVCICVPPRIELGPRNACAHDSRPVRVGESVWEWSSTVDVVDGMAWHGRSDCAGTWACFTPQGAFKQGAPVVGAVGRRQVSSGAAKWQCDGSLTAGDAAWTWATKPSIQHGMAWHANRPGPWPGALMGALAGSVVSQGDPVVGVLPWAWGRLPSGAGLPWCRGRGALGAGPSRPRAFASWQQKMDGWGAPRREGNQGEGVEPLRGSTGHVTVSGLEVPGTSSPGWCGRERDRDWMCICIYVCLWACPESTSWTGVEGGVAPCRTPTRYISPPNEMTHAKASLVVGGLRAPRRRCEGRGLDQGAHRGPPR